MKKSFIVPHTFSCAHVDVMISSPPPPPCEDEKAFFSPFRILFLLRKHTKGALYLWAKKENERVGNTNKHTLFVLFFPPRESLLLWLININTPSQDVKSELTHSAFPPRYTYVRSGQLIDVDWIKEGKKGLLEVDCSFSSFLFSLQIFAGGRRHRGAAGVDLS